MSTDNAKYGVSKEDIRKAALGDFDDFEPENKKPVMHPQEPVIPVVSQPQEPVIPVNTNIAEEVTVQVEDIPTQQTVFCTMCGRELPETAKFCTGCGNQMSAPVAVPVQEPIQQVVYNDVYTNNVQPDSFTDVYSTNVQPDPYQPVDTYSQAASYVQDDAYGQDYQYQNDQYAQPDPYAQGAQYQQNNTYVNQQYAPARPLKTDRNGIVALLLSFVTFGIYGLIFNAGISDDVDLVCARFDGKKNLNFWLMFFVISPLTLGIGAIVWMHSLCARIGRNLTDRGISYSFGAGTFWGWCVLGSFIFVGPFIFMNKLATAMNLINEDYNMKG